MNTGKQHLIEFLLRSNLVSSNKAAEIAAVFEAKEIDKNEFFLK